jgi:hypothetical protein
MFLVWARQRVRNVGCMKAKKSKHRCTRTDPPAVMESRGDRWGAAYRGGQLRCGRRKTLGNRTVHQKTDAKRGNTGVEWWFVTTINEANRTNFHTKTPPAKHKISN